MHVVAVDPLLPESPLADVTMVSWPELLASSDVISLHAPALPETVHLVDERALAAMKPGTYLVNCARGTLVDQDALLQALDRGHLAGAALDVTVPEPLPAGHPLLEHPNVIVTPHVASSTAAGRRRLFAHAIDNAIAVIEGRTASTVPPRTA
jgi:phosphoglycerate dehydrogenase-like enzyme